MNAETSNAELIGLLRDIDGFGALEPDILDRMARTADYRDLTRGDVLIKEGDAANTLFIVLRGRFTVLRAGRAIAEIPKGEPIGELAFFAGGTRTATVVAARDSAVMCLSRAAYDGLAAHTPALANGILAAVSQRLARTVPATPHLRPESGHVCAMFPGGANDVIDPGFVTGIRVAFEGEARWQVIEADDCDPALLEDRRALATWLDMQEATHGNLLLICTDPKAQPVWQQVTANNSDTIMIVAPKEGEFTPEDGPSQLERAIFEATLPAHLHVILHRPSSADTTSNTRAWLDGRAVRLHHHLALDSEADFARIARFVRGEAIGLVMCGGGSYGTAHLAVIKALKEQGYTFDFVGGTSVGAAMAGALALGLEPDEIMEQCEEIFLRSKAMSRLTVPLFSLLDHSVLDAAFRKHYGLGDVEDLPLNFFAVSTNLTHNDVSVIREGPLWQAIRASSAIPGIFPPYLRANGEVLIDGGLIDNVPIDAMRALKAGSNVVLNFVPGKPWTVEARYEDYPTRLQTLTNLMRRSAQGAARHPTAFTVLARAMVVNARKLLRQINVGEDVLLNISVLRGMSFMNWKRGRELFDTTYAQISDMLGAFPQDGDTHAARLARLHRVAGALNATIEESPEEEAPLQPRRSTITDPTE
ncbi:cyclic nucleotide-binding and patatin-like phospholipase domain-containing protein [uncultured Tateyamaria sp.]|uniref:patatin-like phospholipase family protein n=1 Tax=uncultured Tateyamaria sp. TaxID=455651 RepID=UPI00263881E1|nr:cyclic nucleotide-binding and patatin-like phospholipase domain-containing protein [uncultured Tateyamaria sp.]